MHVRSTCSGQVPKASASIVRRKTAKESIVYRNLHIAQILITIILSHENALLPI